MNLLGEMLLEGQRRNFRRRDTGEAEQLRPSNQLWISYEGLAEEASWGTLGDLLVRPVSRGRLLASKLAVVAALVAMATFWASLVAVVAGVIGFGWQTVDLTSGASVSPGAGLERIAIATPYIAWSLAGVASLDCCKFRRAVPAVSMPSYAVKATFV